MRELEAVRTQHPGRPAPIDTALARVLGLRAVVLGDTVHMPALDWKLYDRALNPGSKVTEAYRSTRGVWSVYIGGLYVGQGEAFEWLSNAAFRLPHLAHFGVWRDSFAPVKKG